MIAFKIALVLLCTSGCFAQADFRFYVFDETKNDKLHFQFGQDVAIHDFKSQEPRLVFCTEYRIYGINQEEFTFTTESYAGDLTRKDYNNILERLRKLPVKDLEKRKDHNARAEGWIDLDGKNYSVLAPRDAADRKEWQAGLDEVLKKYAPVEKRRILRRTIEGDTVKPRKIDFATLLKTPEKFDGKRISLTGFCHGEFDGKFLAASEKEVRHYKAALWFQQPSTFAAQNRISLENDTLVAVEGTFELGDGGHRGMWMGDFVRLTGSQPIKVKQGAGGQPATITPTTKPK